MIALLWGSHPFSSRGDAIGLSSGRTWRIVLSMTISVTPAVSLPLTVSESWALPILRILQQSAPSVFPWLTLQPCLYSTHFPIGRKSICFQCCVSEFSLHQRLGVLKMLLVSLTTCLVQALCGFCGYCSTGSAPCSSDRLPCGEGRRVLLLCDKESGYTGERGVGFL